MFIKASDARAAPRRLRKLSVVVPCHNEEGNLDRFPDEVAAVFQSLGAYELILIDDGSTDGTWAKMQELSEKFPVVLVKNPGNRGMGASLRNGFEKASGDAIVTLDADLTFHPSQTKKLLEAFTDQTDCVMGSPILGTMDGVVPARRFLSEAVNSIYKILLGRNLTAVSSMFRLYRTSSLKSIGITSNSFDINAEILFKMIQKKMNVVEVPVSLERRRFGVSKINIAREIKNHLAMFLRILKWRLA